MNIPLNIDWQQIILHLLNFGILSLGLYILLYNPVKKFMDQRSEFYSKLDADAKDKLEHARSVEAEYQERLANVEDEIEAHRTQAAKEADLMAQATISDAKAQAAKVISEAKTAALQERKKIMDNTQQEIVQMAVEATEKILADNAYEQFLSAAERSAKDAN